MATQTAKKLKLTDRVDQVKKTTKDVNNFVLETSDDVLEATFKSVDQWQDVAAKAVKGGLKLAETQQDIFFTALETLKDQLTSNVKRMRTIFSKN